VAGETFLTVKQVAERLHIRPAFVRRGTGVLSVKQAAEKLGVSAKLVYSLCAGGKIVHERHGLGRGTIRIAEEALEEYRRGCTVGTRAKEIPTVRRTKSLRLKHLEP